MEMQMEFVQDRERSRDVVMVNYYSVIIPDDVIHFMYLSSAI